MGPDDHCLAELCFLWIVIRQFTAFADRTNAQASMIGMKIVQLVKTGCAHRLLRFRSECAVGKIDIASGRRI